MKAWFVVLAALAILAPAAAARAQEDPSGERLARQVGEAIRSSPRLTIFDAVHGRVEGGTVILEGKVTTAFKKDDIEARVARVDGVRDVRSEISTLPASAYDDDLRRRVARAIYGNPAFWPYAAMASPPIHILVEHGRVTLAGRVHSNAERAMAGSLATGAGGMAVVNELRTERMRE